MADEAQTIEGHFWLPENPDRRIEGELKLDPGEGFTLTVSEPLAELEFTEDQGEVVIEIADLGQDYEEILGESFSGKRLCLTRAFSPPSLAALPGLGPRTTTVIANRVLVGTHEADPEVVSMTLHTPNLVEFFDSRLQPFAIEGIGGDGPLKVEWANPGTEQHATVGNVVIGLEPNYEASFGNRRALIKNEAVIKATAEGRPLSELERACVVLQLLVEVLSQRPARRTVLSAQIADGTRIEVHQRQLDAHENRRRQWIALFQVAEHFEEAIRLWFELADLDEMLFGALRDLVLGGGSTPDRTLWAIRFVERYQTLKFTTELEPDELVRREQAREAVLNAIPDETKEWIEGAIAESHRPTYRDHLKAVINRFDDLFDPILGNPGEDREKRLNQFTKTARDTRGLLAHLTSGGRATLKNGIDQHYFYERMWLIGRACVLHHLNFSVDEIKALITADERFAYVARQPLQREDD